jgi:tetratricopeptide (TPR) repeat protein
MSSEPPAARGGWSRKAIVLFAVIMTALTAVGLVGQFHRPRGPHGLPDDPAVAAARAALGGSLEVAAGELRFESSFDDPDAEHPESPTRERMAERFDRIASAARALEAGRARHPFDPRFEALLGHLELATDRLERAERHYRAATWFTAGYGEARLGLGVTLARRASAEGDERERRALTLEAIAQFAAVDERDRFYLPALFDRTLLLAEVGRMDEARRWTRRYLELEPGGVWNAVLLRKTGPDAG